MNERKIKPESAFRLHHGDKVSLDPEATYSWRFECVPNQSDSVPACTDTQKNLAEMNNLIDVNLQKTLGRFTKEKEALEEKVLLEKQAQEQLKIEKERLEQELERKRQEFEAKQKHENDEFEQKLFTTKEIYEQQRYKKF